MRSFMIQALYSVIFLIGRFPSCRLDTQRCPYGCMCSIEEIGRKLSLSCETSAQKSGSDYFFFPSTLPNNTRVFSLTVANEGYTFQESDISFADISWRQVEEITLRSVRNFQLTKTRLAGVPRLRVLRLQAETLNNILHSNAFLLVPNIEVLDLSYNRRLSLQTVVAALNKSLPILKYLDLCSLQNAFNDPFILNKDFAMAIESKPLITLNVSNTTIFYLEHGLTSESIRYLNISYTSLTWIARHPNEHLIPNLEEIDFSHTDVPYWKMSIMMRMTSINHTIACPRYASSTKRYIGNNMASVDPIYIYDYRLRFKCNTIGMEEIHLRYSNIRWLNITIYIILFSLKYIDLEGNSLEFLSPSFIQRAPNLQEIYIARNRLSSMINLGTVFQGSAELEVIDLSQNEKICRPFLCWKLQNVQRLDLVWDMYFPSSIKKSTREKLGSGVRVKVAPQSKTPANWKDFLRDSANKEELFFLLFQTTATEECPPIKELYSNADTALNSKGSSQPMEECTHEETDLRNVVHLLHSLETGNNEILIRTVSTYVTVDLIGQMFKLLSSCSKLDLWVAFGKDKGCSSAIYQESGLLGIWTTSTRPGPKVSTP